MSKYQFNMSGSQEDYTAPERDVNIDMKEFTGALREMVSEQSRHVYPELTTVKYENGERLQETIEHSLNIEDLDTLKTEALKWANGHRNIDGLKRAITPFKAFLNEDGKSTLDLLNTKLHDIGGEFAIARIRYLNEPAMANAGKIAEIINFWDKTNLLDNPPLLEALAHDACAISNTDEGIELLVRAREEREAQMHHGQVAP